MSGEAPRLLSHDTVYLVGATAGEALRRAAVVADAILADDACYLDHVLVRPDPDVGFDVMLNVAVPGSDIEERYLTSDRLDDLAQAALDKLKATG